MKIITKFKTFVFLRLFYVNDNFLGKYSIYIYIYSPSLKLKNISFSIFTSEKYSSFNSWGKIIS